MIDLHREVSTRRRVRVARRAIVWVPLVAAAALSALALSIATDRARVMVVAPPSSPTVIETQVIPVTVPQVIVVPAAAPAPPVDLSADLGADLGACPPADEPLDERVGSREPPTSAYDELVGVVASTWRHGAIVAWSTDTIYLSIDDGRSFREILDGPGEVTDVAIDCHGRVFALRDRTRLGVRHRTDEAWRSIDFLATLADEDDYADYGARLAANAGAVAIVGQSRSHPYDALLAVSRDVGTTWRFERLGPYEGSATLRIDGNGVIRAVTRWGDCMGEGALAFVFDPRAAGKLAELDEALTAAVFASDGWIYRDGTAHDAAFRFDDGSGWRPVRGIRSVAPARAASEDDAPEPSHVRVLDGGDTTFLIQDDVLYRVRHGRARRASTSVPDLPFNAADPAGRLLAIDEEGNLLRWSPRHGLRHLDWGHSSGH